MMTLKTTFKIVLLFCVASISYATVIHCPESKQDTYFQYFSPLVGSDAFSKESFSYAQSLLGGLTVKCVYTNTDQTQLILNGEKVKHTKAQDVNCFNSQGNPHGCNIDVTILPPHS